MKKDEFIGNCSPIDDVIIFFHDGKYIITPVADKKFVGKNILYANIFKKNDKRTIYVCYRDGKEGQAISKVLAVTSVVRDREYDVTQGTPDSRITYFTANPNGEAEIIKVTLKPNPVYAVLSSRRISATSISRDGRPWEIYSLETPRTQDSLETTWRLHAGWTESLVRP